MMSSVEQAPLGTPYTAATTSEEVMAGVDLTYKVAVVTGGYSGLGLHTTTALTRAGAHVIVPARRVDTARAALDGITGVQVVEMDLADQDSIRAAAAEIAQSVDRIDLLFATAGIMATPLERTTQGWESQFAVNHLGHFALTMHLWPLLATADSARVVLYSSAGHHLSPIRWSDIDFTGGYDKWQAYGQSKTAMILFGRGLTALGAADGIEAFSLHPGAILTPLQRHLPLQEQIDLEWVDEDGNGIDTSFKSVVQGAATGLWAATSTDLTGRGGVYCEDCDIAPTAIPGGSMADGGVQPYAIDPDEAERLWEESLRRTGIGREWSIAMP
ncbi:oxidoreductase [Rhodococcus sp. NBC_00297]|uniref:oxidoreductase n=1 Tax=Rhodococcus sp. NBC_00297 TaxID=2976005 RepID=UPI002E2BCAAB|nr:oxidoreductase [Rhodococcus sp. NBC_00297]